MLLTKSILLFYWVGTSNMYKSPGVMLEETARCWKRGVRCASSLGYTSFSRTPTPECSHPFPLGGRGCAHVDLSGISQFRNKWVMSSELEIANSKGIIVIKYKGGLVFISAFRWIKFNISSVRFKFSVLETVELICAINTGDFRRGIISNCLTWKWSLGKGSLYSCLTCIFIWE